MSQIRIIFTYLEKDQVDTINNVINFKVVGNLLVVKTKEDVKHYNLRYIKGWSSPHY